MNNKKKIKPHGAARWLISRLGEYEDRFSIQGDLQEEFNSLLNLKGPRAAKRMYWQQAIKSIPPYLRYLSRTSLSLLFSYIKQAIRALLKHRTYSFINIAGLATGVALFLLIMLFVHHQFRMDTFNENYAKIFRLQVGNSAVMPPGVGKAIRSSRLPVEACVRFKLFDKILITYQRKSVRSPGVAMVDDEALSVFTFPLVAGNPDTLFKDSRDIILSQSLARRIFAEINPIGKIVRVDNRFDMRVAGIMKDVRNFHMQIEALGTFRFFSRISGPTYEDLYNDGWELPTYLLLSSGQDAKVIENQLDSLFKRRFSWSQSRSRLVSLQNLYFYKSGLMGEHYRKMGDRLFLYIYIMIGCFILVLAAINFINLSTARGAMRAREVGIKKVVGGRRGQLIVQFLSESIIIVFISILFGIMLAELLLPVFCSVIGLELQFHWMQNPVYFLWLALGAVGIGLLSGAYPALYLSSFQPGEILTGKKSRGRARKTLSKSLIVIQFSIATTLIICLFTVKKQLVYMKGSDLGFNKSQVVTLPLNRNLQKNKHLLREKLLKYPDISAVSFSCRVPGEICWNWDVTINGIKSSPYINAIDPDYLPMMGIPVISGRNFSFKTKTDKKNKFIINDAAAAFFQLKNPVGATINGTPYGKGTIIGVVKNFHFNSLHKKIEPLLFYWDDWPHRKASIRVSGRNIPKTLADIKRIQQDLSPAFPFEYFFLDESFDQQYRSDERLLGYFTYFTFLALFIACLGLLGLVSYVVVQRRKEIGIRKVLGASVRKILFIFCRDFSLLVLLANLIAWPVAYVAMKEWLNHFAFQIDPGLIIYVSASVIALLLAVMGVSLQAFREAKTDPVQVLRSE